jgi:hypothetical protein
MMQEGGGGEREGEETESIKTLVQEFQVKSGIRRSERGSL